MDGGRRALEKGNPMYRWANAEHTLIVRIADNAYIPADPSNRDYQEIVASGVAIGEYVPPPKEDDAP